MKKLAITLTFLFCFAAYAQKPAAVKKTQTPKLVVGIVVDQMRYDYLWRYWTKYGNGGFKKLLNEGYSCKNTHFNYVPTYTAPGHASIYTGTTPATHGIISNNWYDRDAGKIIYCVDDWDVKGVGTTLAKGQKSPKRMLVTTMSDQLRLSTLNKSKTFGIAIKERSAILPAGHTGNGAFWFDGGTGGFVSSTHYMEQLPAWVQSFNEKKPAISYLSKGWKTLLPIEQYTESLEDNSKYEYSPTKTDSPVFPYDFSKQLAEKKYEAIAYTPFGNTLTKDLAIECIKAEQLGKDEFPDMLCVSFSCTDIIAHSYGTKAIEVEDTYLRLDKDIEELIMTLDKEVGKGNYTIFLTADHGGAENAEYLKDNKIPAGLIDEGKMQKDIRTFLHGVYGDSLALAYTNQQIHLNNPVIWEKKINKDEVIGRLSDWLMAQPGISEVYSYRDMRIGSYESGSMKYLIQRGYNHKLSGDVIVHFNPAWMEYETKGTTHGAPYSYDTHVPLIFYGAGVKKGETVERVEITDIAPTISQLLNIEYPNGCIGNPVKSLFE